MSSRELRLASAEELRQLIVRSVLPAEPDAGMPLSVAGLTADQLHLVAHLLPPVRTLAAVLMPIVVRPEGLNVLFTERATHLRNHAGQISFPGGRIEAADGGPVAAALRETEEEIGLSRRHVHTIGFLPRHLVLTGYCITPVVAFVQPEFDLTLDTGEVAEVFEVPLTHFLDPANHQLRERAIGEFTAQVYDFPFGDKNIWGATAGIIMTLYRSLMQQVSQ